MGKDCNLELRLLPPAVSFNDQADRENQYHPTMLDFLSQKEQQQQQQQLTIFYQGRMTTCDVTELQAKAIIQLASCEMDKKSKTPTGCSSTSPLLHSQQQSPTTGLSMKRSLQRFLGKRRNRVQSHSPYHR